VERKNTGAHERRPMSDDKQPGHTESIRTRALGATACACMAVFGVVLLLMGSLLPSMAVNYSQAGTLGSLPLIGILIATIMVGPFLDILGARPVLAVSLALIGASLAMLPSLRGFAAVAAAALIYGFGGGLLNTATNAFVSDLHSASRGSALNLLGAFFSIGAVAAPLLMSSLAGLLSAQNVVRLLAATILLLLVPILGLRFPPPSHAGSSIWQMLRVLNQPLVWLFGILLLFESGNENTMFVWGGKVLADVTHVPAHRADQALVGLTVALGVGRLIALGWVRRAGNRVALIISAAIVVAGAAIARSGASFRSITVGLIIIGFGMSTIYPTTLAVAGDRFPRQTGTVFGAIMAVALVGGVAAPRFAAVLTGGGLHPLNVLWIPLAGSLAIAALATRIAR
jgi:fucose permease